MFLNPGPMIAPDIILKGFVDSRISLTNVDVNKPQSEQPDQNNEMENSIMMEVDDNEMMASDDIAIHENMLSNFSSEHTDKTVSNDLAFSLNNPEHGSPCFKKYYVAMFSNSVRCLLIFLPTSHMTNQNFFSKYF